tara:strand:+ start:114 stop:446 length:333 start_codon:yes stop_codon:yes gene_type:complete
MSLKKSLPQSNGYDASHWIIESVNVNLSQNNPGSTIGVQVSGFKDKAAYDAGSSSVNNFYLNVEKEDFAGLATTGVATATKAFLGKVQKLVKELMSDNFSDAVEDTTDLL